MQSANEHDGFSLALDSDSVKFSSKEPSVWEARTNTAGVSENSRSFQVRMACSVVSSDATGEMKMRIE